VARVREPCIRSHAHRPQAPPGFVEWELVDGAAGLLRHRRRFRGTLTNRMRFDDFPYDSDTIGFAVNSANDAVKLYWNYRFHPRWLNIPSLNEWVIGRAGLPQPATMDKSALTIKLGVQRQYMFYIVNVLLVVLMLMVLSWAIFNVPMLGEDSVDSRMNLSITLFLAMVAFLFVTKERLPKVSYLTVLDEVLIVAFVLVWLAGVETWVAYELWERDLLDATKWLDSACAWASPAIFVMTCVFRLSSGWYNWMTFRSVMVACETAVTVVDNWVESLRFADPVIMELAQFREKSMMLGDPGDIHEGICVQEYDPIKMQDIQVAYKVVEVKRRVAQAMRHLVAAHEEIVKDFDPRDHIQSLGGKNYFGLNDYWARWTVRGYASKCFERLVNETFHGTEIKVNDLVAEEMEKVERWASRKRMMRRILAWTLAVFTLGLSTFFVNLDYSKPGYEDAAHRLAMAMKGGARSLEAQDRERLDDEDKELRFFNKVIDCAEDERGRFVAFNGASVDPDDRHVDERSLWGALLPIMESKRTQMEHVWPTLFKLAHTGVKRAGRVARPGTSVCLAKKWYRAAGVGQLGCLGPGEKGVVDDVMFSAELPIAVRSSRTKMVHFYKADELVQFDATETSKITVLPDKFVRFDNAVRGLRVRLSPPGDERHVTKRPSPGCVGTLVQRGDTSKWWKVLWDDGMTGLYRVGEAVNGVSQFELVFAAPYLPGAACMSGALVTTLSLEAQKYVGVKVRPGPSIIKRKKHARKLLQRTSQDARDVAVSDNGSGISGSQAASHTTANTTATVLDRRHLLGGLSFKKIAREAEGTIREVDPVKALVLVEWDVDFMQWHPIGYSAHLVFAQTTEVDSMSAVSEPADFDV